MSNTTRWLIGLSIGGAATAVGALLVTSWMSGSCPVPPKATDLLGGGPIACLEFWVFRYQTMIVGVIALGAAVIAIGQFREARMQAAIASYETFFKRSIAFSEIERFTNEAIESVRSSLWLIRRPNGNERQNDIYKKLCTDMATLESSLNGYPGAPEKLTEFSMRLKWYLRAVNDIIDTVDIYRDRDQPHPRMRVLDDKHNTEIMLEQQSLLSFDTMLALRDERKFIDNVIARCLATARKAV